MTHQSSATKIQCSPCYEILFMYEGLVKIISIKFA